MKTLNKKTILFLLCTLSMVMSACEEDYDYGVLARDNRPEIPVTFPGTTSFGFNPYYTVSRADGNILIRITIPQNAAKQIKEIRKVVAGSTAIIPADLRNPAVASYLDAPVTVNGYEAELATTINEFNSRVSAANAIPDAIANAFVERAFLFHLVMDDDSEIIPVQLRIRITP